jgi:hypothetical protein
VIEKRLIFVGRSPQNDIVLEATDGSGVSARHLQLFVAPGGQAGYRLVNVGDTPVYLSSAAGKPLAPRDPPIDVAEGEQIKVGDFTLILANGQDAAAALGRASTTPVRTETAQQLLQGASAKAHSRAIGLELTLPQRQLDPERPIEGSVIVRNLGDQPAAQFKLVVEGLPDDCYEIGAGPLLFPNAEKEVFFRITHPRGPSLVAGNHRFSIRATAPEAYPEQSATVSQAIQVLPYYRHTVRLVTAR